MALEATRLNNSSGCKGLFFGGLLFAKYGNDIFNGNDKELIVGLKVDRNGIFGMEKYLVVLP